MKLMSGTGCGYPIRMVQLTVNGDDRSFENEPTVSELLAILKTPRDAVAVEVNRVILPRGEHDEHRLQDGDAVEVVTFVGGG